MISLYPFYQGGAGVTVMRDGLRSERSILGKPFAVGLQRRAFCRYEEIIDAVFQRVGIQIRRIVFPLTEQSAEHVVGQQCAGVGERVRRLRKPPVDQKQ